LKDRLTETLDGLSKNLSRKVWWSIAVLVETENLYGCEINVTEAVRKGSPENCRPETGSKAIQLSVVVHSLYR